MNGRHRSTRHHLPLAFYILSAEKNGNALNANRTRTLRAYLARTFPGDVKRARGHTAAWGDEASSVVFVHPGEGRHVRSIILACLDVWQQDAALYVTPQRVAYLITGPGFSRKRLGLWRAVTPGERWDAPALPADYTECGGVCYSVIAGNGR